MARILPFAALAASVVAVSAPSFADEADECDAASARGQKLRRDNRLLEARRNFARCAQVSCPTGIQNDCVSAMKEIIDEIPSVIFDVKDPRGNDLVNVRVILDGAPLTDKLIGRAYELEPGPHLISFEAEGMLPIRDKTVIVSPREKSKKVEIVFQSSTPSPPPPPPPNPTVTEPPPQPLPTYQPVARPNRGPAIAFVTIGGIGLAIGATFGVLALGTKSNLDSACNSTGTGKVCPGSSQSDVDALNWQSHASTIALAVGGIGVGVGLILFASSSSRPAQVTASTKVRAQPYVGLGSVGLKGEF